MRSFGTLARHTPWKPSQPAMKSQAISWRTPSSWKLTRGAVESKSCTATSAAS